MWFRFVISMTKKIVSASIVAFAPYPLILMMQVVFAGYLSVEEIGQFALVNFLLMFFMTSTNWGVDKYIIAHKHINKTSINTIFSQELMFAIIMYLVCFFVFRENVNTYIGFADSKVFWACIGLIFLYPPLSRPKAILEKDLLLLPAYMPALAANIIAACIGCVLAIKGFGIWSMIAWKLAVFILEDLFLFIYSPGALKFRFSFDGLGKHSRFCLPLYFGAVISFFSVTADIWIIRSMLGTFELGLYWFAFSISHTALALRAVINRILLPALAAESTLERKLEVFIRLNSGLQIMFVIGMIAIAYWGSDFFSMVFGSKWSAAGPLFVILFYAVAFKVISGTANPLLHSVMKTSIDLNVSIVNSLVLIPLVLAGAYFSGVKGAAVAVLISTLVMTCYVYQSHVRTLCGRGFWYFFSYLTINVASLISINFFFEKILENIVPRILATFSSLLLAYIILNLPTVTGRKMSLSDLWFGRKTL